MNYWVFKANPENYNIDDRLLATADTVIWSVTRYLGRIQAGDTVFVWRAGLQPGICAVMEVLACPYLPEEQELNDGFEIPVGSLSPVAGTWAKCRLIRRFQPIEKSIIRKIPGLDLFSFFSAFQGAINYTLTHPEGARLVEYMETHPLEEPRKKVESAPKPRSVGAVHAASRTARPKASKPAAAGVSSEVSLLKCGVCGRYVVKSDTERHIREVHTGEQVEWLKTR